MLIARLSSSSIKHRDIYEDVEFKKTNAFEGVDLHGNRTTNAFDADWLADFEVALAVESGLPDAAF